MIRKVDKKNNFVSLFNPENGFYLRSGVIKNGKDTGVDPFMTSFPELIDVGIMGHCIHGRSGLCLKSGVQCYQDGIHSNKENMTLENYKRLVAECKGKTFQYALGGCGDVDQHEHFEEILKYTRENGIVPNFTSSGLGFTPEIVKLCKKYCGAVAISQYSRLKKILLRRIKEDLLRETPLNKKYIGCKDGLDEYLKNGWEPVSNPVTDTGYEYLELSYESNNYTYRAIKMLLEEGVTTNIHYVLGNNSIDEAIERLKNNDFPSGINAVVFLLHKPIGLGKTDNCLKNDDPKVHEFFLLIDTEKFPFQIGFDSCSVPGLLNHTSDIDPDSIDTCEGGRWSCYITSDMKMLPCSFDNQALKWAYDISNDTIQNAWDSPQFEDFRNHFRNSCAGCENQRACKGGCPICRDIVLCSRKEKNLV